MTTDALTNLPTKSERFKATAALSIIQLFATLSYAVLYSTLVLYITQKLKLSIPMATAVMGTFGAFNYGLHLLGGYFGGRFLSWRFLFFIGMITQIIGCLVLSIPSTHYLYIGLAFFLTGSGLNVTCINMMVTQLFQPDDKQRENAFFWNYALMNVGFFVGFSMAGYYQLKQDFHSLFILASVGNIIAMLLTFACWKMLADRNTILSVSNKKEYTQRFIFGLILIGVMIPSLRWLVEHANFSNLLVLGSGAVMALVIFIMTLRQKEPVARAKMSAYLIFAISSVVFWTLYQLAPMALTVFAQYNVDRHYFGYEIAPQWIQNINTFVIAFGGPLLGLLFVKLEKRGINFSLSFKFSLSLMLIGIGLVILPLGIKLAASNGLVGFNWIFYSYVFQSVGELFIGPIGYAMVGQLAPQKSQGLMMGTWMMGIGIGFVLSNYASVYAIQNMTTTNPLMTNPGYAHMFNLFGWASVIAGLILFVFTPLLKKLTFER